MTVPERIERAVRAGARAAATAGLAAATLARARRAERSGSGAALRAARALVLADAARQVLALHGISVRAAGPLPTRPVLLASNHLSYLDPLVVSAVVACVPISKADLSGWPVFGAVARRTGVLFYERGDARSGLAVMREAQRTLAGGLSVLNFPEGTTTEGGAPLPFRPGLFGVARRAGVDVVPVALAYDPPELAWVGDATFVPHYLGLAGRARAEVHVTFGAPVASGAFASAGDLAAAVRERVAGMLEDRVARPVAPAASRAAGE